MSSYGDFAWSFNEDDLGLDPETGLTFEPNKKELDQFKSDKTDMYKGTWFVCLIYGFSAIMLLSIIFFTDWGRKYIYDKFLPAVITYVVGAIFIIIYLIVSIFALKPRKIGKSITTSSCPDYWKTEYSSDTVKKELEENNTLHKYDAIANEYDLSYKCIPDKNVFGKDLSVIKGMKNELYKEQLKDGLAYSKGVNKPFINNQVLDANDISYLYTEGNISNAAFPDDIYYNKSKVSASKSLKNYAQLTGLYNSTDVLNKDKISVNTANLVSNSLFRGDGTSTGANRQDKVDYDKYPLICSEVYPNILNTLEYDKSNNDKLKCEYAKACNVSWSHLDCYDNNI
jgi:hypothetical protein